MNDRRRISFFMPFQGCGRRCVYCDQRAITGADGEHLSPESVGETLASCEEPVEVCFFGGSFARQPREDMIGYLESVRLAPPGSKITFSSYPGDFVGPEGRARLELLGGYPIATIELGIPSLDPAVLRACGREDDAERAMDAVRSLRDANFHLGVQVMIGLPGQARGGALGDLRKLAVLKGDARWDLRIYPCLVLRNAALRSLWEAGFFTPLSLEEAVLEAGELLVEAEALGFTAVRVGLQDAPALKESVLAGPYHPAFGELAHAEKTALRLCAACPLGPWEVSEKTFGQLRGHGGRGIGRMAALSALSSDEIEKRMRRVAPPEFSVRARLTESALTV